MGIAFHVSPFQSNSTEAEMERRQKEEVTPKHLDYGSCQASTCKCGDQTGTHFKEVHGV